MPACRLMHAGDIMGTLLSMVTDNLLYKNPETNRTVMRCDDNTVVVCETIAICFQTLLEKLDEIASKLDALDSIDPNPINPGYR
jgi:hypothetical protein